VFGNTASPFCSQYVIQTHCQQHAAEFPEAADSVANSMYVDDLLDSSETVESAQNLRCQLTSLLASAGFNLRKWASNETAVIESIAPSDRLSTLDFGKEETLKIKTLGVMWEAKEDVFTFQVKLPESSKPLTKRNVLSTIAAIYDPLQFLSPFIMRAKVLMQEIWLAGLGWDHVLPNNLATKWEKGLSELSDLSRVNIPRALRLANPTNVDLHLFSDASRMAFATVAYLVCLYDDSMLTSRLIASTCRVAPVIVITIPRLELMGALLSCRLAQRLLKVLTVNRVFFWTDSENVWYWVHNQSKEFKPFVANRVGEIQRTTNPEQWHHVPGTVNPAGLATRGMSAAELVNSVFWTEGPQFLKEEETLWPASPSRNPKPLDGCEKRVTQTFVTNTRGAEFIDPQQFSSFRHLCRVTAWILRFTTNAKQSHNARSKSNILSFTEIAQAEKFWIRQAQGEAFPRAEKDPTLLQLNPRKDDDGLLRMDGRLRLADELPYDTKHPILLPKNHSVTSLIVMDAHECLGHGSGVELLLTRLRAQFWIVKGRKTVRTVIETCPVCRRRFLKKTGQQMMAPLPRPRLESLRAFDKIGVDYAGPFLTKQGRGTKRAKRYLCLFTCLATRAVHLEMAYSLDSDSFINAFVRMVSRRETPSYVVSDNGTNFVAAERELRELIENLDQEKIVRETTKYQPITWKFNPPSAPHFGGVFEALIKSAKKAIKIILGDADIRDEELHTAICGAEKMINSRPITYVSADPNDLSPLTPNHLIVGQIGGRFAPEAVDKEEVYNQVRRWHRVQQLLGLFWKRWRKEFLPSLNVRKKWFHPHHNLKPGDVVLIAEPKASRGDWPLGRILEAYPGSDGLVRTVKLKSRDKEYFRPIHRLCPLEYVHA
jgi:hypothetical protein